MCLPSSSRGITCNFEFLLSIISGVNIKIPIFTKFPISLSTAMCNQWTTLTSKGPDLSEVIFAHFTA